VSEDTPIAFIPKCKIPPERFIMGLLAPGVRNEPRVIEDKSNEMLCVLAGLMSTGKMVAHQKRRG